MKSSKQKADECLKTALFIAVALAIMVLLTMCGASGGDLGGLYG